MRVLAQALFAVLLCAVPVRAQQQAVPPVQPIKAIKIILVGDSTVQAGSGWGGAFCAHHLTSFAACVNLGRGGRSSSSYTAEGSWQLALNEMATPGFMATYVLIQFGHNDQPGKPGRSTDLVTEFPVNIARYVTEARAKGATPVLVTPLARRQFKAGKLDNDLVPWADAIRKIAMDTNTPLLDLNADSAAALQALGPVLAARFAQMPPSPRWRRRCRPARRSPRPPGSRRRRPRPRARPARVSTRWPIPNWRSTTPTSAVKARTSLPPWSRASSSPRFRRCGGI